MPLVRISMRAGRSQAEVKSIGDAVHRALVEAVNAPADAKFLVITEHGPEGLVYPPSYMGVPKSDGIVIIQVTMNAGRTIELKRALYAKMAELLAGAGVKKEDIVISLLEIPKENWSWGGGEMTYVK